MHDPFGPALMGALPDLRVPTRRSSTGRPCSTERAHDAESAQMRVRPFADAEAIFRFYADTEISFADLREL
ncbi:hypothetical protein [Embleya sp. NPDC005575]|uniref:hypothetical protein n=1 Tax=Embleya sp. NPDC005575 TaxID=3156892 RepID=UPI0033A8AFAC